MTQTPDELEKRLDTFLHRTQNATVSEIASYPIALRENEVARVDHGLITIGDAVYFRSARYCKDEEKGTLSVHNELVKYDAQTQETKPLLSKSWTGPIDYLFPEEKWPAGTKKLHDSVRDIGFYQSILPLSDRHIACIDVEYKKSILAGEWNGIEGGSTSSMNSLSWPTRAFLAIYDLGTGSRRAINLTDCIQEELVPHESHLFIFKEGRLNPIGSEMKKEELVVRVPPGLFSYNPVENVFTLLHHDDGCFHNNVIKQEIKIDSTSMKGYVHQHSNLGPDNEQQAAVDELKMVPQIFVHHSRIPRSYSHMFPLVVKDTVSGYKGILGAEERNTDKMGNIDFILETTFPRSDETVINKLGALITQHCQTSFLARNNVEEKKFPLPWDGLKMEPASMNFIPGTQNILFGLHNRIFRIDLEDYHAP